MHFNSPRVCNYFSEAHCSCSFTSKISITYIPTQEKAAPASQEQVVFVVILYNNNNSSKGKRTKYKIKVEVFKFEP